jgi:hypothetical protein
VPRLWRWSPPSIDLGSVKGLAIASLDNEANRVGLMVNVSKAESIAIKHFAA